MESTLNDNSGGGNEYHDYYSYCKSKVGTQKTEVERGGVLSKGKTLSKVISKNLRELDDKVVKKKSSQGSHNESGK